MKIKLVVISKTDKKYLIDGIALYAQRIVRYVPFEIVEIPDLKNAKSLPVEDQKKKEGDLLLQKVEKGSMLVLLDDKGQHFTSVEFAQFVQGKMNLGLKELVFAIGGPYGFSQEVYAAASGQVSLSKMTFSHQIIRLLFAEQLYRAFTILKGEPYHHE